MDASEWNRKHKPGIRVLYRRADGNDVEDTTVGPAISYATQWPMNMVPLERLGLCTVGCVRPGGVEWAGYPPE